MVVVMVMVMVIAQQMGRHSWPGMGVRIMDGSCSEQSQTTTCQCFAELESRCTTEDLEAINCFASDICQKILCTNSSTECSADKVPVPSPCLRSVPSLQFQGGAPHW